MKRTLLGLGFAFAFSSIGFAQQSSGSSATGAGTGAPGGHPEVDRQVRAGKRAGKAHPWQAEPPTNPRPRIKVERRTKVGLQNKTRWRIHLEPRTKVGQRLNKGVR